MKEAPNHTVNKAYVIRFSGIVKLLKEFVASDAAFGVKTEMKHSYCGCHSLLLCLPGTETMARSCHNMKVTVMGKEKETCSATSLW